MSKDTLDKKGVFKAMFIALVVAFLGIGILGWQYRELEKKQLPALEEKIEKKSVEDVLDRFMEARIIGSEEQAMRYLTEGAAEQHFQKEFTLIDSFESYEIVKSEKLEDQYRYIIRVYENEVSEFIEVIALIKIMDKYYINSVEIAG